MRAIEELTADTEHNQVTARELIQLQLRHDVGELQRQVIGAVTFELVAVAELAVERRRCILDHRVRAGRTLKRRGLANTVLTGQF